MRRQERSCFYLVDGLMIALALLKGSFGAPALVLVCLVAHHKDLV